MLVASTLLPAMNWGNCVVEHVEDLRRPIGRQGRDGNAVLDAEYMPLARAKSRATRIEGLRLDDDGPRRGSGIQQGFAEFERSPRPAGG